MIERLQIELQVESDARSHSGTTYLNHEHFIKYCKANGVYTNVEALETYEKKGLLYPCFRLLYPSGLLKSRFRAEAANADGYNYREEWGPLINLEVALSLHQEWATKEFRKAIIQGHPLEQAFAEEMPFIVNPSIEKSNEWSRYNVVEGWYDGIQCKKSRAIHYYSTWKLFLLDELNSSNTVSHNLATGQKSRWWLEVDGVQVCSLYEFIPYFGKVASFSYRHYLREIDYLKNSGQTKQEWDAIVQKSQRFAREHVKEAGYKKWIRFLRKLIELHEAYMKCVQIIISEEIKRYIVRTVRTIRFATDYDFKRICDDVCGPLIHRFDGVGYEDGVHIYPRMLEEILADEEWDLRRHVKRHFELDLKEFNKSLVEEERIPERLCDELFDELIKEPEGAALAAIRKINKALNIARLYHNTDIWGGINELARSVEVYGRLWHGGKHMENILVNSFSQFSTQYVEWKKEMTEKEKFMDVADSKDFLNKLTFLLSAKRVPCDRRLGRHILVAHLTRNYASHHKGLTGKVLKENLGNIYSALINTMFVLYAAYKKQ